MFLAKYIDQKQGEAKVVDKRATCHERLDRWLKVRPTIAEVAELGIIGRDQRFEFARGVVDEFLVRYVRLREAERCRIPAGPFTYPARLLELLDGDISGSKTDLRTCSSSIQDLALNLRARGEKLSEKLKDVEVRWAREGAECCKTAEESDLSAVVQNVAGIVSKLNAHRESAEESLRGVFDELEAFQRLSAKKSCLEGIVGVAERTETVREAVFACVSSQELPIGVLEEVPGLCLNLPTRTRALAAARLRLVLPSLRTLLAQELHDLLKEGGWWPRPSGRSPPESTDIASVSPCIIGLCADLQRAQEVHNHIAGMGIDGLAAQPALTRSAWQDVDKDDGLWACFALAEPLRAQFRQLFRPGGQLFRRDRPQWAFKYLLDNAFGQHSDTLSILLDTAEDKLNSERSAAIKKVDLFAGLAGVVAREARHFVRSNMVAMARDEDNGNIYQMLQYFVTFHADICALGGIEAGNIAFSDFDTNRPLVPPATKPKCVEPESPKSEASCSAADHEPVFSPQPGPDVSEHGDRRDESRIGRVGARLFGGLSQISGFRVEGGQSQDPLLSGISHLRKTAESDPAVPPGPCAETVAENGGGGLVGARLARMAAGHANRLASVASTAASSAAAGIAAASPMAGNLATCDEGGEDDSVGFLDMWVSADAACVRERLDAADKEEDWPTAAVQVAWHNAGGDGPVVAEIAGLIKGIFEASETRACCLSSEASRVAYCRGVLDVGLQLVLAGVKSRWNSMADPFSTNSNQAAMLIETMTDICDFLNGFQLARHVSSIDEAIELKVAMVGKLADALCDAVSKLLYRLDCEAGVFSFAFANSVATLAQKLQPLSLRAVMQQGLVKMSALLTQQLQRVVFPEDEAASLFAANCSTDLHRSLGTIDDILGNASLEPLEPLWDSCILLELPAARAEQLLATLRLADVSHFPGARSDIFTREAFRQSDEGTSVGALTAIGIKHISVGDAISVLNRRSNLEGAVPVQSVLQELMPASAALSALQLSAETVKQFGEAGSHAPRPAPVAAAQATLQGVQELRGFAGGAGRLLAGRLRSTLAAATR